MKLDSSYSKAMERNYSVNLTSRDDLEATANFTQANMSLVLDEDPGWKAAESLFGDFVNTFVTYPNQHQVFDLFEAYEDLCDDQLALLRSVMKRGIPGQTRFARTIEAIKFFQEEKWTWRLLRLLYRFRFDKKPLDNTIKSLEEVEEFQELVLVKRWCEMNAGEVLNGDGKVQFFAEKLFIGENTLHQIKAGKHGEMDIDASVRNPKQQDELDKMDEERLIQLIFAFIRSGEMPKAIDLCVHSGQPWRAAALSAAEVYRDDNFNSEGGLVVEPVGNSSRDLWKATVWRVVEDKRLSAHERATMGILCGHLPSVTAVCASWQDYLWAYSTCVAEYHRDASLRSASEVPLAELPASAFARLDLKWSEIFGEIEASGNQQVVLAARDPFRMLQKMLILNDATTAIGWLQQWLTDNPKAPKHLLRFVTHMALGLRLLGLEFDETEGNDVVISYVKSLIQDKRTDLVATYAATLPHDLQVFWYARFLEGIKLTADRQECLEFADGAGLDLRAICIQVVKNIIDQPESMEESFRLPLPTTSYSADSQWITFGTTTSEDDLEKIGAIEWLLFDTSLRYEAMLQANSLARMFLAHCKHSACKELFSRLPVDCQSGILQEWRGKYGSINLPVEMNDSLHEYLCIRAYLEAHDQFIMWLKQYEGSKPKSPTVSSEFQLNFADSVAVEHLQAVYEEDLHNWQTSTRRSAEIAIRHLMNVLTFPDGRWMKDSEENGNSPAERRMELRAVRRQCVPLVCAMLMRIYSAMEMTRDAANLASIVASEDRQLYQDFNPDELKNFLSVLLKCSSGALDRHCDAFGYPLP